MSSSSDEYKQLRRLCEHLKKTEDKNIELESKNKELEEEIKRLKDKYEPIKKFTIQEKIQEKFKEKDKYDFQFIIDFTTNNGKSMRLKEKIINPVFIIDKSANAIYGKLLINDISGSKYICNIIDDNGGTPSPGGYRWANYLYVDDKKFKGLF